MDFFTPQVSTTDAYEPNGGYVISQSVFIYGTYIGRCHLFNDNFGLGDVKLVIIQDWITVFNNQLFLIIALMYHAYLLWLCVRGLWATSSVEGVGRPFSRLLCYCHYHVPMSREELNHTTRQKYTLIFYVLRNTRRHQVRSLCRRPVLPFTTAYSYRMTFSVRVARS